MNKLVKIIPHNIVKTPKKPQLYKKKKRIELKDIFKYIVV